MDFKVIVSVVAFVLCGYLFWQNQKRSDTIVELTRKYQSSLQQAATATSAAVVSDEALMLVIRQAVKSEWAARPSGNCATPTAKLGGSDAGRLQDLSLRLANFEKRFNKAAQSVTGDGGQGAGIKDKITEKAVRLKDRIVSLCKK